MSQRQSFAFHRSVARVGFVCLIGSLSAACSSDTMRFAESPFGNPFASSARVEPQTTASVVAAPTSPVQSQSLPPVAPVAASPLPPLSSAPAAVASAAPSSTRPVSLPGAKGWTTQGGSTVSVGAGETVKALSNRYGVPEQAIRAANGLSGSAQPSPGSSVIIPVYHATAIDAPASAAAPVSLAAVKPAASAPVGSARMQLVKGAQPVATASTAPARPAATAPAPVRTAKVEPPKAEAPRVEAAKPVPAKPAAVAKVETKPTPAAQPVAQATKPAAASVPVKAVQIAKVEPAKPEAAVEAAKPATSAAPAATVAQPDPEKTASISKETPTEFRWPARGRVIAGFGGKGGGSNDGINIALPEGTPVKAAEAGTVAYAGSELKGYGNLVLIRHSNGYVTAYAHNGELKVKRGDTVTRGQTIAISGQSGNVSTPQLHFEIRKGSTPVDPLPHLGS